MSLKSVALVNLTIVVNNLRCIKTLLQSIAWSFQQQWSCQESAEKEEYKLVQYAACDFCPHFFVSLAYHEQRTYMEPSDSWLKCAMAFPQMKQTAWHLGESCLFGKAQDNIRDVAEGKSTCHLQPRKQTAKSFLALASFVFPLLASAYPFKASGPSFNLVSCDRTVLKPVVGISLFCMFGALRVWVQMTICA